MTENVIGRAEVLIQQQKYAEAEKLLRDVLSTDPNDVYVLTLLSEINLQLNKIEMATMLINSALSLSPDAAHL
ncbi:MAG TPA: tetratricopeptide repeat protein, partial [Chryseolinea sp.]|nr:tetratricopeptide repeat protein [Chryseolinea sp.]